MGRRRPENRFAQLLHAATRVFIRPGGFRRAQIQDVAKELGVAKGTVYLYVESKEALFDLCIRAAAGVAVEETLPVPTPKPSSTVNFIRSFIVEEARFDALEKALAAHGPVDAVSDELTAVIDEIYGTLGRYRTMIRLIEASAQDLPELGELWYAGTRGGLVGRLTQYLEARMTSGDLRTLPDAQVGARMLTQIIYWFAVQRFYDPSPDDMNEVAVRQSVREAALGFCGVAT